jgi:2-keto-4-pentenoate hydratase
MMSGSAVPAAGQSLPAPNLGDTALASFDPKAAARAIADAHAARQTFANLAGDLAPPTISDAYAAQEALAEIWADERGPVRGLKIATTTKVMQALMGIDHPCGGMIFEKRMHSSPARLRAQDYIHVVAECELAVRLGRDLDGAAGSYTGDTVRDAVDEVMAAFELIEDRNAVYKETDAKTLIVDDAWNAGIVTGAAVRVPGDTNLNGIDARLFVDGKLRDAGKTDDPMGALAWVANLAAERGRPLQKGMVVITGSVVATLPIEIGETFKFEIDGVGAVEMTLDA